MPGTTIGVMLLPSYVEVRDKGVVKKKIRIHGKSFDYVLGELELYFRAARKMLRPGLLEEVLIKIGLPKADIILPSGQTPTQKEEKIEPEPTPEEVKEKVVEEPKVVEVVEKKEKEIAPSIPEVEEDVVVAEPESTLESKIDSEPEILEAPEVPEAVVVEEKKPSIRISISGVDDIVASSKTYVTAPNHIEEVEAEEEVIGESAEKVEPEELPSQPDETNSDSTEDEITPEVETPPGVDKEDMIHEETSLQEGDQSQVSAEPVITEVEKASDTDTAVIRAIIDAKGLILGEDIVGRATLLSTAGFEPVRSEDDSAEISYHFKRVLKLKQHRVCLDVWHFDEAVKAGIQRKEFYESPDVVLVVYSVVDRWSFESLTYWLKEIAVTNEILPPLVIVGNKADLRMGTPNQDEEPPVTEKEGFDYAEELATTLARDGNLHPVAFIETSCETQDKVLDAFRLAAELFIKRRD